MGRAFEVRKAAMAKTSAMKAKVYSKFGKEIYLAAKSGIVDPENNLTLRRVIESAKRAQVPSEIIKRAIEKAKGSGQENYQYYLYEVFGPGESKLLVECLSDNVNRTLSDVRAVINKCKSKIGVQGSLIFNFTKYAIFSVKNCQEEALMLILLENDVDFSNLEVEEETLTIYGAPEDYHKIATCLEASSIEVVDDAVIYLADETVTLNEEEKELFNRLIDNLNASDDVQEIYHNVAE